MSRLRGPARGLSLFMPRNRLRLLPMLDYAHGKIRDEIEEQNSDLVNGHTEIMQTVELFGGQLKESSVVSIDPVMGRIERNEPNYQDHVVYNGAPCEHFSHGVCCHQVLLSERSFKLPPKFVEPPV